MRSLMNTYQVHTAFMSPTLYKSSALERFEHSNAIEIRDKIKFDFYLGLPHIVLVVCKRRRKAEKHLSHNLSSLEVGRSSCGLEAFPYSGYPKLMLEFNTHEGKLTAFVQDEECTQVS